MCVTIYIFLHAQPFNWCYEKSLPYSDVDDGVADGHVGQGQ